MTGIKKGLLGATLLLFGLSLHAENPRAGDVSGRFIESGTTENILEIVSSVNRRHPKLIVSQTQYKGNIPLIYRMAFEMKAELKLSDNRFFIPNELPALSMRLTSTGPNAAFVPENIQKLKDHLIATIDELRENVPNWRPVNLNELLQNPAFKRDPKIAQRLVKIMPWFLDLNGELLPKFKDTGDFDKSLQKVIAESDGTLVNSLYYDVYFEHLRLMLKGSFWEQIASAIQNGFFERDLNLYLSVQSSHEEQFRASTVSIELVPPLVALLRGAVGYDCSMWSVPLYALLPGTDVFWIRDSSDTKSQPSGYALVTQARVNGQLIPYVVTINGQSLNALDTRATLVLIAKYYGVSEVLTPDFSKNDAVVNDQVKRAGMKGEVRVVAEFSDEWKNLEQTRFARLDTKYGLYYSVNNLKHACKTSITALESLDFTKSKKKIVSRDAYRPHDFKSLSLFERAILAVSFSNNEEEVPEILKSLNISDEVFKTAKIVTEPALTGLTPEQVEKYAAILNIDEERVFLALNDEVRFKTLTSHRYTQPWADKVARKVAQEIIKKYSQFMQMGGGAIMVDRYFAEYLELKDYPSVPDANEAFTDVVADFLMQTKNKREDDRLVEKFIPWKRSANLNEKLFAYIEQNFYSIFSRRLLSDFLEKGGEARKRALQMWLNQTKGATGLRPIDGLENIPSENRQQWADLLSNIYWDNPAHLVNAPLLYLHPFQQKDVRGIYFVLKVYGDMYRRSYDDDSLRRYVFRDETRLTNENVSLLRKTIWNFIWKSLNEDAKPAEEVFAALPAFYSDKSKVIDEIARTHFKQFIEQPGFLEAMIQSRAVNFLQEFTPVILRDPRIANDSKVRLIKSMLKVWTPDMWAACAEMIADPKTDDQVLKELLWKLKDQQVWTKEVWDAVLQLVRSERSNEIYFSIIHAYDGRLLPFEHRAAIVQLAKKLPNVGYRNILRQLQIRNTGVALTVFPQPLGFVKNTQTTCEQALMDEFKNQTYQEPNWAMRQWRRVLQRLYPRWR